MHALAASLLPRAASLVENPACPASGGIVGPSASAGCRVNAGLNMIHWAVALVGGTMAASGYISETDIS
jgi:hypothetical protein